ncbi:MAG: hypothetical protein AAF270_05500 [Pseudomonadota bacterium]
MREQKSCALVIIDKDVEEPAPLDRASQIAGAFDASIELFSFVFHTYVAGEPARGTRKAIWRL